MCCRDPSDKMFDTLKWGRFKDVLFLCERTVWRAQRFSSAHNWSRRTNIPQTCVPAPGGLVRYCTQRIVVMKTHSCVPYVCFLGWPSFPLSKERKKESCNEFLRPNTFSESNWKSALRSCIAFASTDFMHRHRSHSPLHFDNRKVYQIRTDK